MSSYFAIRCRPLSDIELVTMLQSDSSLAEAGVTEIICPSVITMTATGIKSVISQSFSYVYLAAEQLTSQLFQFLNANPLISQILEDPIPESEVDDFCQSVGLNLEDARIEIALPRLAIDNSAENHQELIEKLNEPQTDPASRNQIEKKLAEVETSPSFILAKFIHAIDRYNEGFSSDEPVVRLAKTADQYMISFRFDVIYHLSQHREISTFSELIAFMQAEITSDVKEMMEWPLTLPHIHRYSDELSHSNSDQKMEQVLLFLKRLMEKKEKLQSPSKEKKLDQSEETNLLNWSVTKLQIPDMVGNSTLKLGRSLL